MLDGTVAGCGQIEIEGTFRDARDAYLRIGRRERQLEAYGIENSTYRIER
jgi:hypothetical protein